MKSIQNLFCLISCLMFSLSISSNRRRFSKNFSCFHLFYSKLLLSAITVWIIFKSKKFKLTKNFFLLKRNLTNEELGQNQHMDWNNRERVKAEGSSVFCNSRAVANWNSTQLGHSVLWYQLSLKAYEKHWEEEMNAFFKCCVVS